VVLLKNDGTLWRWGTISNAWQSDWSSSWPGLPTFKPYQIGTDSDWQDLFRWQSVHLRKTDGTIWSLEGNWRSDRDEFRRETNFDLFIIKAGAGANQAQPAFVQTNGTLWVFNRYWDGTQMRGTGISQVGHDNDWQAVTVAWGMMVGLKTDGSLWQWHDSSESVIKMIQAAPKRLGIHSDWVAITSTWNSVLALAGDGSLWLWPDKENHDPSMLLQYPKQPQFLGNVFSQAGQ
jgi:alpha-tubulin suppressor-like RCC1 family protein